MKLRTKFSILGLVCITFVITSAGYNHFASQKKQIQIQTLNTINQVTQRHMQADMMHDAMRADVLSAILSSTEQDQRVLENSKKELQAHYKEFLSNILQNQNDKNLSLVIKQKFDTAIIDLNSFYSSAQNVIKAIENNTSHKFAYDDFKDKFDIMEKKNENISDEILNWSHTISKKLNTETQEGTKLINFLSLGAIISTILLILLSWLTLFRPLLNLIQAMNKLAEGCIDFNIPNYKSNNEITDMAHAIRIFKNNALTKEKLEQEKAQKNLSDSLERQKKDAQDSLILQELSEVINAFTKGNLNKHINLDNKQGTLLEICKGVNKINDICKTIFSDLNQSLSQMARGNLEVSISNHYEGMFADIVSSLNTTIRNMKTTIFEILSASKKLEEMAIRISKESNNVSQNMMSQASMLEETSTSMKEIRNSVSSNSNFTNKSVEIAKESYDYVQRGTKTVCDTITMMQNIENAAHSISNIVNMIESVSMQTNLLALNAAVEAARAGDLGKGFAVVAGEVRQLAADCSKASEQIRNLIVDTVENIKEGSNLAQKSGNEMNYVSQQIEQLNQIMTEIATTSRQQSISISEITTSIHQMDNITQNNTNSIESSARLSEEILSQVEYLNNILSVFQVKKHKIAAAA